MAVNELHAEKIRYCLPDLQQDLLAEFFLHGIVKPFSAGDFIIKQETYIKYLPIVLEGSVKVFSTATGIDFLLYYIYPSSTCVFSFAGLFAREKPEFSAVAEADALLLLLPSEKAAEWQMKYIDFNHMILREYQRHYHDLLETTRQLICYNLEDRLLSYLKQKAGLFKCDVLAISHQSIANDLATSREVISRALKKMEGDKKLMQEGRKIKVML